MFITVSKDNGSFLVLLDLSTAVHTNGHDTWFYILERYIRNGNSALWLIGSHLSNRTQKKIETLQNHCIKPCRSTYIKTHATT